LLGELAHSSGTPVCYALVVAVCDADAG
jgi:hypothetical protein